MRLVKYIALFLFTFLLALFFLTPKENLYYLLEKELLLKQDIIIDKEKFSSTPISARIEHATIIVHDIPVATITEAKFLSLIFYNQANIYDVEFNDLAKNYLQSNIDTIILKQNILKPFFISVSAQGDFGNAKGYIDLKKRLLHLDVSLDKDIPTIKRYLQKGNKGWYYEYRF